MIKQFVDTIKILSIFLIITCRVTTNGSTSTCQWEGREDPLLSITTRPYTLSLSRGRVGRSGIAKKRSHFVFVMDGLTDRPTDTAGSRVACPRLTNACLSIMPPYKKFYNVHYF